MTATAETCPDCRLPLAVERKTRAARVDKMSCGARFSRHYELECKRVAVHVLRSELATAKRDALLELHDLMAPGPHRREALAALYNLSFKYGAMREIDGTATIGEFDPQSGEYP